MALRWPLVAYRWQVRLACAGLTVVGWAHGHGVGAKKDEEELPKELQTLAPKQRKALNKIAQGEVLDIKLSGGTSGAKGAKGAAKDAKGDKGGRGFFGTDFLRRGAEGKGGKDGPGGAAAAEGSGEGSGEANRDFVCFNIQLRTLRWGWQNALGVDQMVMVYIEGPGFAEEEEGAMPTLQEEGGAAGCAAGGARGMPRRARLGSAARSFAGSTAGSLSAARERMRSHSARRSWLVSNSELPAVTDQVSSEASSVCSSSVCSAATSPQVVSPAASPVVSPPNLGGHRRSSAFSKLKTAPPPASAPPTEGDALGAVPPPSPARRPPTRLSRQSLHASTLDLLNIRMGNSRSLTNVFGGSKREAEPEPDAAQQNALVVVFRQRGGRHVTLRLGCKNDTSLMYWHDGLQAVLAAYFASRLFKSEAHATWIRSMIEAVDKEDAGAIAPRDVPAVFAAANVNPTREIEQKAAELATSQPLRFQQVEMLLADLLRDPSTPLGELFATYSEGHAEMSLSQWQRFCAEQQDEFDEQLNRALFVKAVKDARGASKPPQLAPKTARRSTCHGASASSSQRRRAPAADAAAPPPGPPEESGLTPLLFQHLMLTSTNRAACRHAAKAQAAVGPLDRPMCEYWVATSHNSYLMDPDQIAGHSSAEMYGRLLLQGCRSVELDCWDGERVGGTKGEPYITHGNTLCSIVTFKSVVEAIAEHAFTTSELPVSLSLEMHCSRPQQRRIAELLHEHLGGSLLLPEEAEFLASTPAGLTPLSLSGKVIVKGKIKGGKHASVRYRSADSSRARSSRGDSSRHSSQRHSSQRDSSRHSSRIASTLRRRHNIPTMQDIRTRLETAADDDDEGENDDDRLSIGSEPIQDGDRVERWRRGGKGDGGAGKAGKAAKADARQSRCSKVGTIFRTPFSVRCGPERSSADAPRRGGIFRSVWSGRRTTESSGRASSEDDKQLRKATAAELTEVITMPAVPIDIFLQREQAAVCDRAIASDRASSLPGSTFVVSFANPGSVSSQAGSSVTGGGSVAGGSVTAAGSVVARLERESSFASGRLSVEGGVLVGCGEGGVRGGEAAAGAPPPPSPPPTTAAAAPDPPDESTHHAASCRGGTSPAAPTAARQVVATRTRRVKSVESGTRVSVESGKRVVLCASVAEDKPTTPPPSPPPEHYMSTIISAGSGSGTNVGEPSSDDLTPRLGDAGGSSEHIRRATSMRVSAPRSPLRGAPALDDEQRAPPLSLDVGSLTVSTDNAALGAISAVAPLTFVPEYKRRGMMPITSISERNLTKMLSAEDPGARVGGPCRRATSARTSMHISC